MKSCNGCRHHEPTFGLCKAEDGQHTRVVTNAFDGRTRTYYGFRPTIDSMRAERGPCGPDAILYEPRLLRRLFARLKGMVAQ